ncbi:MAG: hypothetical protein ABSF59_14370 [Candidatus Sulfotelmatobacter sp.]
MKRSIWSSLAAGAISSASDPLEWEALTDAVPTTVEGVAAWEMTTERLAAIALRTGRPKDHNRILQSIGQGAVD